MTTLSTLRANALSPALYADRVPDGVLKDVGLAAWEMPDGHLAGYMNYLGKLDGDALDALLLEPVQSNPAFCNRAHLEEFKTNIEAHGTLLIPDLATIYGRGTSLCLQNTVFSPQRSSGGVDSYHDFEPAVTAVLDEWAGKRLYINVGMANGSEFLTGELRYNLQYPLQCRDGENSRRPFVDFTAFSVSTTDYIHETSQGLSDMVFRPHLHGVFDPTHPTAVGQCLDSLTALATALGDSVRYVVHGESGTTIGKLGVDVSACGADTPLTDECQNCEPATPYSAEAVAGFRAYLEDVRGFTIDDVNARWDADLANFGEIDPATVPFCPGNPAGLEDWRDYQTFLMLQLGVTELATTKAAAPDAQCGVLRFAARGAELSWLSGDFPVLGDWQNHTYESYREAAEFDLDVTCAAARLSGVPPAFPICSAVHNVVTPSDPPENPPVFRAWWRYDQDKAPWFFRDLWTAGVAHQSYLRAPGNTIVQHAPSLEAVMGSIEDIVALHPTHLAMSGAWQRVAIHVEDLEQLKHPLQLDGGARTAWYLNSLLRQDHVPAALFSEARVRTRTLARWWLGRSMVVVPFHSDMEALYSDYVDLFPDEAPGAAIFVARALTGSVPDWVEPTPILNTTAGPLYRVNDGLGDPVNCFYLSARTRCAERSATRVDAPPDAMDTIWDLVADALHDTVMPAVRDYIGDSGGTPYQDNPLTVEASLPVVAKQVTDGLNFAVAVSNMATTGTATVTLGVQSAVADALGVTYTPQEVALGPSESAYVLLEAEPTAIDIAAAIADADAKLDVLEGMGAYDTAAGRELLTQASALLAAHPGRALAAYVAATRMLYLLTSYAAPDLTVTARRIGIVGEADTVAVEGARVQLLFILNGREEQETEGTTNGSGVAVVAVGAPASERWDFTTQSWGAAPAGSGDLVEVSVTDPAWGSSSRRTVSVA